MIGKFRDMLEKWKRYSVFITSLFVVTLAYWIEVGVFFYNLVLSQLKKKEGNFLVKCGRVGMVSGRLQKPILVMWMYIFGISCYFYDPVACLIRNGK